MATAGQTRGFIFMVVSVFAALGGTYLVYQQAQEYQLQIERIQAPEETIRIAVAARDIPPGMTIREDHLTTRKLREKDISALPIQRDIEDVVGKVPLERVLAGEFIREERLADPGAGVGLMALVPRGKRALAVDIKNAAAGAGFVNPGNFVDLIAVFPKAEPPDKRTLLEGIMVLAVNDRLTEAIYVEEDSSGRKRSKKVKPSVTLALTPLEAELVTQAAEEGVITLALRNDIDVTKIDTNDVPTRQAGPAVRGPAPSGTTPDAEGDGTAEEGTAPSKG